MMFCIGTIVFFLIHLAPGGPVVALTGEFATAEYQAAIEKLYGLDRPLHEQYFRFLSLLIQGELGQSYFYKAPAFEVVFDRLPATLILVLPAIVMSSFFGIRIGVTSARKHRPFEYNSILICLFVYAIPIFWLGQILLMVFALGTGLFPTHGMVDARANYEGWRHWLDITHHLLLPCLALTIHQIAFVVLITRSSINSEMKKPYFTTAQAKGNSVSRAQYVHALPNGSFSIVTLIGNRVGWVIAGAILIENVFAWPGLGRLIVASSLNRDYPVILGIVLVASFITILANFISDLTYSWIDPRIRQGKAIDEF